MQNRLITILSCFSFILCGCSSLHNENAIKAIMNYEGQAIEIKAESLDYMIKQKYSFPVLMYTEQCSFCMRAKENIAKYADENGYAIYQIEMYTAPIEYLSNQFPDYFSTENPYPFMYFFNNGNVSYKTSIEDLINYTNFKKMMRSYLIDTNIANLTDLEYYNAYKKDHESYLLFIYDSRVNEEKEIYSKYIFNSSIKTNKNVLIIDKRTANGALTEEIRKEYGEGFDILSIYSFGQIKTTLRYASASGLEISDFINSYF